MEKAIFMDRDGTISKEVGYVNHLSRFSLIDRAADAIKLINGSDFLAVAVTNQAGVARGYFKEDLILKVHDRMETLLNEKGSYLDAIYYCPHHPEVGEEPYRKACDCRKPNTGMLEAAREDLDVDLTRSFMIGDKLSDVQLAHRVGGKGVMVLTGYGRGEYEALSEEDKKIPDHVAEDLYDAVKWILDQ
jgi:D-glycero-D-manno-heptose 1,7-bisphosphate phosphatase